MRALRSFLAASVSVVAASCASAPPPPPAQPRPAPIAMRPAAPPGHLLRADVDHLLLTQGPPWVLRQVLMEPVLRADNTFIGWRLVGVPGDWTDIDLRPGDIVTRVNGLAVQMPDDAWEAWKSVAKAPELRISLTRDGGARQLVLPIDGAPSVETAHALDQPEPPRRPAPDPTDARERPARAVIDSVDEAY